MRSQGTSTSLDKATEEGLADWVNELRSEGIPVSNLLLQSRALEVARDLGFGPNDFKASNAWIQGFMKRWRFAMRSKSRAGQADLAQGEAKLAEFSARIRDVVATRGVETIYNADQTGINYEYIPKKTINQQGVKTAWIKGSGHEKDRLTAMVLADSNGVKYPLFLVLKTGKFKLTPPDRYDLVEWVNTAWECLPKTTIVNGFRKCGIIERPCTQVDPFEPSEIDAFDFSILLENLQDCESLQLQELSRDLEDDDASEHEVVVGTEG
ncbi:hypothetical protein AaE_009249 [Aphanomyces astaci]|uniref:HTH CENPB-type domain-containing protein n=1 Tax=Aphanomyces astaci TaxID=112090 RepID=A0A6A5ACY7_APHAT|nr:hypothetical protein AaE_009249 [Aphanomyces astaci]